MTQSAKRTSERQVAANLAALAALRAAKKTLREVIRVHDPSQSAFRKASHALAFIDKEFPG